MKKTILSLACLFIGAGSLFAQNTITIKGNISFPADEGEVTVVGQQGFDKVTLASVVPGFDSSYEIKLKVDRPGAYTLNCQNHERVSFWAEDEDLVINFRGVDTAQVRYLGPTYVHIQGGPNNELMNMLNWDAFRNYWTGVEFANAPYRTPYITDEESKAAFSGKLYSILGEDFFARVRHLATYYADRNSVLALLPSVRGEGAQQVIDNALATLEKKNPNYGPLLAYKAEAAEKQALRNNLAPGQSAPAFAYETPDGSAQLGSQSFHGKYLVIDFWASWCGPCRNEIPHLKEAYNAYKDKGVEIISVSIDKDDRAWRKAMEEENMPWPQVKAPDTGKEVMRLYQFSGIPHIVVLDQQGNMVGVNYRGKALMDKLEELTK